MMAAWLLWLALSSLLLAGGWDTSSSGGDEPPPKSSRSEVSFICYICSLPRFRCPGSPVNFHQE